MNVFPSLFMKWCKKTWSARGSCVMGVKAENKCIGGKKMPEKNSRHLNKISSFLLNHYCAYLVQHQQGEPGRSLF